MTRASGGEQTEKIPKLCDGACFRFKPVFFTAVIHFLDNLFAVRQKKWIKMIRIFKRPHAYTFSSLEFVKNTELSVSSLVAAFFCLAKKNYDITCMQHVIWCKKKIGHSSTEIKQSKPPKHFLWQKISPQIENHEFGLSGLQTFNLFFCSFMILTCLDLCDKLIFYIFLSRYLILMFNSVFLRILEVP